jgi:hypothetical protein
VRVWAGFIWLRIVSMMAFCELCIGTLGFKKDGEFIDQPNDY